MIVNAYSVVAAFAAVLRVALGLVVCIAGARALLRWRRGGDATEASEGRFHLLVLLCGTLLGVGVASWPLLYLVLESYVPHWPGVMCIRGVTLIGTGSLGPSRWLPGLVAFLEAAKPALVFVSGLWLVLHLANRRAPTAARTGRVLAALVLCGGVAAADGAAETAYLAIPKQETFLSVGCCTAASHQGAVATTATLDAYPLDGPPRPRTALTAAFFGLGGAMVLALTLALRRRSRALWIGAALAGATASVPVALAFLKDVAAPAFLRLPYHHCAYCLVKGAPESLVGIALFALGVFGTAWACAVRWGVRGQGVVEERLLRLARFGALGALLMAAVRLVQ